MVAYNVLCVVGEDRARADKLTQLYGSYAVQVKEVKSPVICTLIILRPRPQHQEYFELLTKLYSALIEEYGFRITQNPSVETFRRFLETGR